MENTNDALLIGVGLVVVGEDYMNDDRLLIRNMEARRKWIGVQVLKVLSNRILYQKYSFRVNEGKYS